MAASLKDHQARLEELREEIKELSAARDGESFTDEENARWEALNGEFDDTEATIRELEVRAERLARLSNDEESTEAGVEPAKVGRNRNRKRVPDDPTDFDSYRRYANNIDDLERSYTDGAKKILETRFAPAHPGTSTEDAQTNIDRMLDTIDHARAEDGTRSIARRVIATSSTAYQKEFAQFIQTQGRIVGPEMQRAASLTTTAGGYAVPVELDTTLILTSSGVVNPVRQIARVRQTAVNTVEFISTAGVTAAYGNEATEASDNAPTLAQPVLNIEKAQAFIPGSIEIFEDWAGIRQDLAMLFQDAKDTLENTKFLTGLGHGSHEPQGLIAVGGATAVVSSAATAVMAVADIYSLENALSPRWRQRASVVGNRAAFQKVRQFATATGPSAWADSLRVGNPNTIIGYPAYEWSAYSSAVTTSAATVLTIGDFNQFAIVDRVGMSVEFIPHLFGGSSRFPTGQRALYCYWRNSSQVLTPGLQANSAFVSLKLL